MKYAIVEDNKVTRFAEINQPFYLNGNKYSARFIRDMSEEQCLETGLYKFVEGTKPDLRFYWESEPTYSIDEETKTVTESYSLNPRIFDDREEEDKDGNPLYVKVWDPEFDNGDGERPGAMVDTDKRLVTKGMKTIWIANIKKQTNDLLKSTDSKVMDETITEEESEYRADVITESDRLDTALQAATDLDELINIVNSQDWPIKLEDII